MQQDPARRFPHPTHRSQGVEPSTAAGGRRCLTGTGCRESGRHDPAKMADSPPHPELAGASNPVLSRAWRSNRQPEARTATMTSSQLPSPLPRWLQNAIAERRAVQPARSDHVPEPPHPTNPADGACSPGSGEMCSPRSAPCPTIPAEQAKQSAVAIHSEPAMPQKTSSRPQTQDLDQKALAPLARVQPCNHSVYSFSVTCLVLRVRLRLSYPIFISICHRKGVATQIRPVCPRATPDRRRLPKCSATRKSCSQGIPEMPSCSTLSKTEPHCLFSNINLLNHAPCSIAIAQSLTLHPSGFANPRTTAPTRPNIATSASRAYQQFVANPSPERGRQPTSRPEPSRPSTHRRPACAQSVTPPPRANLPGGTSVFRPAPTPHGRC